MAESVNGSSRRAPGGRSGLPRLAFALLLLVAAAVADPSSSTAAAWRPCLACHADASLSMTATNGDVVGLAVSAAELAGSAHRSLECDACHRGVRLDRHPDGATVPSADAWRRSASQGCLACHPAERLRAKRPHGAVVFEDQQLACVECHAAHAVRPVAAWREAAAPREYCLGCHSRALTLMLPGGGTVALDVDARKLRDSVHGGHDCDDCHEGFTKSAHPSPALGARDQRGVVAARTCAACHAEKLRQAEGSVHFTLLRSGADGAPGCTHCHSAHAVAPAERLATLTGTPCRGCHEEIFQAYALSMHGQARGAGGHLAAPLCSDCHRSHDVKGTANPRLVRAACAGCHDEALKLHTAWLPNTALHLEAVSCVACHAPAAERVVALRLVEEGTGRMLTEREVGDLLGGTALAALDPGGNGIDSADLWSALRRLEASRGPGARRLQVTGRLEVARGVDAHRLARKGGAVRDCESCHESGATAFGTVSVSLARDDGRPKGFDGSDAVLTEAASILPMRGFYTLGSTRQTALDWLLLLGVAGGLAVVALHLTARVLWARSHKEG